MQSDKGWQRKTPVFHFALIPTGAS